jgi:hypothetical protein
MEIKEFEFMTIAELKKLHEDYLKNHPDEKEVQELLKEHSIK